MLGARVFYSECYGQKVRVVAPLCNGEWSDNSAEKRQVLLSSFSLRHSLHELLIRLVG